MLDQMRRFAAQHRIAHDSLAGITLTIGRQDIGEMDGTQVPPPQLLMTMAKGDLSQSLALYGGSPPSLIPHATRRQISTDLQTISRAYLDMNDVSSALKYNTEALFYAQNESSPDWPLRMDFGPQGPDCPPGRPDYNSACRKWLESSVRVSTDLLAASQIADYALIQEKQGHDAAALQADGYAQVVLTNWFRQNWAAPEAINAVLLEWRDLNLKRLAMLSRINHRGGPRAAEALSQAFEVIQLLQYNEAEAALKGSIAANAISDLKDRAVVQKRAELAEQRRQARATRPSRVPALDEQIAALKSGLPMSLAEIERKTQFSPVSLREARPLIGANEALVMIASSPSETQVFVLTPQAVQWWTVPHGDDWLQANIDRLLPYLRSGGAAHETFDRTAAWAVYQALLAPAEPLLDQRLILASVSGPLSQLPLGVLRTRAAAGSGSSVVEDDGWFVQSHATLTLPSVASLQALRGDGAPARRDTLIAFGDPVINASEAARLATDGPRLTPLRYAGDEIQSLAVAAAAWGGQVKKFVGVSATKDAVLKTDLSSVQILEFATHAISPGDSASEPEASLLLSPPPNGLKQLTDVFLSGSEVANLRVGADLVVLSACESANGNDAEQQSLSGLALSFILAGSRGVLATRWAVNDVAAMRLVAGALGEPLTTSPAAAALSLQAQIKALIRRNSGAAAADPRFWGPFIVFGG